MKVEEKTNVKLKELFEGTSFADYSYEDFTSAGDLIEDLQTQISEDEIIYYSNAMKYLSENDNSLNESMAIAQDFGYECKNINSELLATLHYQQGLNEDLSELVSEIEEIFDNV